MARYTHLLTLSEASPGLGRSIARTLEACGLNLVYANDEYFVAKEKPGHVALSQLTTIEVLITPPTCAFEAAKVNLVVKNEELPLQKNNHCQQMFEAVSRAIGAVV